MDENKAKNKNKRTKFTSFISMEICDSTRVYLKSLNK